MRDGATSHTPGADPVRGAGPRTTAGPQAGPARVGLDPGRPRQLRDALGRREPAPAAPGGARRLVAGTGLRGVPGAVPAPGLAGDQALRRRAADARPRARAA